MFHQLGLRVQKLLRKIRHFNLNLTIFIPKLIADKFPFLARREDIVIVTGNQDFIDGFCVGLDLVDLFGGV